ncbi:MAG: hypothetical protein WCI45_14615, partial [Desulfuromonadales bacterium]
INNTIFPGIVLKITATLSLHQKFRLHSNIYSSKGQPGGPLRVFSFLGTGKLDEDFVHALGCVVLDW